MILRSGTLTMGALVRATRTRAAALAVIAACGMAATALTVAGTAGAASAKVPRCEKITVKGQRWGVYVAKGKVSCVGAGKVLRGVLAGNGKSISGSGTGGSRYDGWVCPYDQMGFVTCQHGTKPVANASWQVFGLSCASGAWEPACPARGED
jgi:hypothetical protein